MPESREATSPPLRERGVQLKLIDHGGRVEVLYLTTDGWVTIYDRSREHVLEALNSEASDARRIEAQAKQRADAFEWAANYIRAAPPQQVGERLIIGEHAVDSATRRCVRCGAAREFAESFRRCDGDACP